MAITRAQIARQLLAEGGVSLDDAKMMAPPGEFLAYINPKEADMLRAAGGSGIMTAMGIPSFVDFTDSSQGISAADTFSAAGSGGFSSGNGDSDGGFTPPPIVMADPDKFVKTPAPGPIKSFFDNVTSPIRDARQNLSINYIRNELERRKNFGDTFAGKLGFKPQGGDKRTKELEDALTRAIIGENVTDVIQAGRNRGEGGDSDFMPTLFKQNLVPEPKTTEPEKTGIEKVLADADEFRFLLPERFKLKKGGVPEMSKRQDTSGIMMAGYGYDEAMSDTYDSYLDMKKKGLIPPTMDFREFLLEVVPEMSKRQDTSGMMASAILGDESDEISMGMFGKPVKELNPSEFQELMDYLDDLQKSFRAEGGLVPRQAYGLGSIVKSVTRPVKKAVKKTARAVKKIAKSDLGKLALAAATIYFAPQLAGRLPAAKNPLSFLGQLQSGNRMAALKTLLPGGVSPTGETSGITKLVQSLGGGGIDPMVGQLDPGIAKDSIASILKEGGIELAKKTTKDAAKSSLFRDLALIGGPSVLAGVLAKEDIEDEDLDAVIAASRKDDSGLPELLAQYDDFRFVVPEDYRQSAAEGGMMDLGGNEMDLRGGGFVPIGREEKADDVPARLSKNEFVFTADAVRAAGGGSVDKGADLMYKTMKQLENKVA